MILYSISQLLRARLLIMNRHSRNEVTDSLDIYSNASDNECYLKYVVYYECLFAVLLGVHQLKYLIFSHFFRWLGCITR